MHFIHQGLRSLNQPDPMAHVIHTCTCRPHFRYLLHLQHVCEVALILGNCKSWYLTIAVYTYWCLSLYWLCILAYWLRCSPVSFVISRQGQEEPAPCSESRKQDNPHIALLSASGGQTSAAKTLMEMGILLHGGVSKGEDWKNTQTQHTSSCWA